MNNSVGSDLRTPRVNGVVVTFNPSKVEPGVRFPLDAFFDVDSHTNLHQILLLLWIFSFG